MNSLRRLWSGRDRRRVRLRLAVGLLIAAGSMPSAIDGTGGWRWASIAVIACALAIAAISAAEIWSAHR